MAPNQSWICIFAQCFTFYVIKTNLSKTHGLRIKRLVAGARIWTIIFFDNWCSIWLRSNICKKNIISKIQIWFLREYISTLSKIFSLWQKLDKTPLRSRTNLSSSHCTFYNPLICNVDGRKKLYSFTVHFWLLRDLIITSRLVNAKVWSIVNQKVTCAQHCTMAGIWKLCPKLSSLFHPK